MRKRVILAAALSGAVCTVQAETADTSAGAQDLAAGEKIYQKSCRNCHGPKAQGMASFPKLTGNGADYIVKRLKQYRSGEKVGPNSPLMMPQAAKLSDDDIKNLANYISTSFE